MEHDKYMYNNPQMIDWSSYNINNPKELFDLFGWTEDAIWNEYFLFAAAKCRNSSLTLVNDNLYRLQGSYNFKAFTPQLLAELFNVSVHEIQAIIEGNAVSIDSLQESDWCEEVENAFVEWWVRGYMATIGIPDALYPNVMDILGLDCNDVNQIHIIAPDMLKSLKDFALLFEAENRQQFMNNLTSNPIAFSQLEVRESWPNKHLNIIANTSKIGDGPDPSEVARYVRELLGKDTNELMNLTLVDGGYQGNYINIEPKFNTDKEEE